mmetsp:Transcript_67691/g.78593  ORF Transcript_67691/g.78593 Transcript_67691/m.78593 type:complete len:289 (-) Transcript_67691:131-997(-)
MRRRSCAFHADSNEEYIKIATESQEQELGVYNGSRNKLQRQDFSPESDPESKLQFDDFSYNHDEYSREMDDFDLNESNENKNSPSAYALEILRDDAVDGVTESEIAIKETRIDTMLIGGLRVGKHALIDSQFPESSDADSTPLMNRLDLVVRKTQTPSEETSIRFWIKEIIDTECAADDAFEKLIELYYKRCSVYIFVYDMTSRASFEKIENEISKIVNCVGESRFLGLLVATNSDKTNERTVSYEEGVALKIKFNLRYFNETNIFIERETQQLLKKLQSLATSIPNV